MKRFFIELSYNGGRYCGWQRQINAPSVQQTLEESLAKLLGFEVGVVGCGRTDTGVHASFYVAHLDIVCDDSKIQLDDKFVYKLNAILPKDIAVQRIYETNAHARFDAKKREYKYYIGRHKDVFNSLVWQIGSELDYEEMNIAARKLLQFSDFTSFAKIGSDNKTNICTIYNAHWSVNEQGAVFTIEADRFLRGMVRAIVGTLINVGRGKLSVDDLDAILNAKDRKNASAQAPAQALFLTKVEY